jgi:hypothetical protein
MLCGQRRGSPAYGYPDQGCGNPVKWLLKLSGDQVITGW